MVGIKRVVDFNVRVRVRPDNTGVITDGVKMSINPFDEIALEEALRIKERGQADEVLVGQRGARGLAAAAAHGTRHGR
jgi:electron transfer flavoprotein beta subunit